MNSNIETDLLSCDWGTSRFRLRLVEAAGGRVLAERETPVGVASLAAQHSRESREEAFANYLLERADELLRERGPHPICCLVSGMAGSSLGWREIPYAPLPQPLDGSGLQVERLTCQSRSGLTLDVLLISGLRDQNTMMRGEEVEAIGLAQLEPELRRHPVRLVLPGTHSKHLVLEDGAIRSFSTHMTGELFSHLRQMPTLREALTDPHDNEETFRSGVQTAVGEGFSRGLFLVRARRVLNGATDGAAFLSGLLIGTELLSLRDESRRTVWIACAGPLGDCYRAACAELGFDNARFVDPRLITTALVEGHRMIWRRLVK